MGLLEIIDQTFRLYRRDFLLFFGIAVVVYLPVAVLQSVPVLNVIGMVLGPFVTLLASGALAKAVSDRYLGTDTTVSSCYRYIALRFGAFLLTVIVTYFFILTGLVLLLVGAIVFAFWCAFVTQVFVIEGKRSADAIRRSKFLIGQGVWAQVFVLYLVIAGIAGLIMGAIGLVTMLPSAVTGHENASLLLVAGVLSGLAQALIAPIGIVGTVLLYYDSRIRKEGFDLQILAQEMGAQLPPGEPPYLQAPAPEQPPPPTPPGESSV
jgi:hypothetical protein